jgi:hypothetical protein
VVPVSDVVSSPLALVFNINRHIRFCCIKQDNAWATPSNLTGERLECRSRTRWLRGFGRPHYCTVRQHCPIQYWLLLWRGLSRAAVHAPALLAPVLAVARAAVLAPVLSAPVLAAARAAVLALALQAPVLAVARAAVPALALQVPVLAVARAAVLALALGAPVLALRRLFRSPKSWLPK